MKQIKIPAVFMRGGTSKAIVFKQQDLPADRALWPEIFLAAQGSPDPFGRQLNGMGGGISSLSKICVIGPPSRNDADIDYTFAQVGVRDSSVGFASNCGNMSSAMAPFAVDEGFAAVDGEYVMSGVAEPGAKVRLDFLDPGGAITGRLLPTGSAVDVLDVPGLGEVEASVIDAAMAGVFVDASALGLEGTELPEQMDATAEVMDKLEALRREAGYRAGIADSPEAMARQPSALSPGIVSGPRDAPTLSGERIPADGGDLVVRIVSNGNTHRALPATGSVCVAVAARIGGSVVQRAARKTDDPESDIRIVHPSGEMALAASVRKRTDGWHAVSGTLYRTQRRLFEGFVYVPASKVPGLLKLKRPRSSAAD
jgi:2-methylaconitate cis-trans-isomerase PrpF